MANPLVAQAQDSTTAISGVPILEAGQDLKNGIESGDWAATVMGVAGTAMEALAFVADPFGSILAAGVGWLLEHVGPLKEMLDKLAGDPDQITAHSQTWANIAKEVSSVSTDLAGQVKADIQSWTGPGADAYRKQADEVAKVLEGAAQACDGASSGVKTAGDVVAAVRMLVRDIIAEVVGHMVSWAIQVIATLGIGLAWVVPQVVNLVAKTAKQIADLVKNLTKALGELGKLLGKAGDLFKNASKSLKSLKSGDKAAPGKIDDLPGTRSIDDVGGKTDPASAKGDPGPKDPPGEAPKDGPKDGSKDGQGEGTTASGAGTGGAEKPKSPVEGTTKPENARDTAPGPDTRNTTTDPVDLASGEVILEQTDLELPGLLLERVHVSSYRAGRWFGPSWSSTVDQRLEFDPQNVCYVGPDGVILVYPLPVPGQPVLPEEGARWPLTRHADGSYTVEQAGRGRTLRFSGAGTRLPLRTVEDADGARTELSYDDTGAPVLLAHSSGVRVGFRTEGRRLTELRVLGSEGAPDVVVLRYGYDGNGHLAQVVNASGAALRFDHDTHGRLTGWQDRNGVFYRYVYDSAGRCVRTVGAEGFLDGVQEYDRDALVTRFTDSLGHVSVYELNALNQVVRETDPLGHVTESEWDRYDRLLSRTDPLGRVTRYTYTEDGVPLTVTRPDGSVVELEHADGELVSLTVRGDGRVWRRFYDRGSAPDPLDGPLGIGSVSSLDTEPESADADGETDRDQFGRPRSVPEVGGGRVLLGWTIEGRPASRTGVRRERAVWRYDGEGNEIEYVDELGRATRREYGPFDLVTAVTDPAGARTRYGYDTELRLTSVTDPLGRVWTYRYDPAGRLVSQTDFEGRTWNYAYDAAGQLISATGPDGGVTENVYDLLGNLVEVRGPHGTTSYVYDPVGALVRVASADSVVEFDRDEYGRVIREAIDGAEVTFAYDEHNRTIRRRTPSGAASEWRFDEQDRPIALTTTGHTVRYRLDAEGRTLVRDVDGVSVLQQAFGPRGLLTTQQLSGGTVPVQRRGFEYRADGSLAGTRDEFAGPVGFTRDAAGRVVSVSAMDGREDLRYDAAGHLIAWSGGAGLSDGYDALGRRTRHSEVHPDGVRVWEYTWTGERLTGLRTPDGRQWRYSYDPLGRRIGKQCVLPDGTVAESTRFVWDGTVLIEQEYADAAGVRHVTTWERRPGGTEPVTQYERGPAGERFLSVVTDAIGTPTELVDAQGRLAWSARRALWGRVVPVPGAPATTPLRFPGQYADAESGLHYNVFRYYDPAAARYVSQDPLGLEGGPNPVAYVADPFAEYDPLGLMACKKGKGKGNGNGSATNSNAKHNAGNSGGSAPKPGKGKGNKRKRDDDGDGASSSKKPKKDPGPWDRSSFSQDTLNKIKEQKNDPNNPHYKGNTDGGGTHARHIISFQTMRDSLKNWVEHQPKADQDALTAKYSDELYKMNSKIENLPLGPGKPNTAIGSVVNHFEDGIGKRMNEGSTPSDAFKGGSGYIKDIRPEYGDPIMRPADNFGPGGTGLERDPDGLGRDSFMNDMRDSADMDWPGGTKEEFEKWNGVRLEISDIGKHPENYTPAQVDDVIKKFHDLQAPSGGHPSLDEFNAAPQGHSYQRDEHGNRMPDDWSPGA
ncbi:type IV secretion protein Rhs [Amycolatopsis sp. K13G38]|uniref:Type IV secretion protein Rhs n=1 Tax=Amycolatopsis acididurans TaxID=2724524 RepID=A0ABX1JE63_9PSEU|nr:RHS repeat-associated core domain-containing protein [Amycolatopsis acididurans]NKQ56990.1 type IV secretion protein Rhs [Amycolatopsis acididurans]